MFEAPIEGIAPGPSAPARQALRPEGRDILSVEDLRIDFADPQGPARQVVAGATLRVPLGGYVAVIGASGSGKSLTCLATMGLVDGAARVSGRICFAGRVFEAADTAGLARLRGSGIAMIFQDPFASLNPVRSIGAQIVETLRVHDASLCRQTARKKALALLDRVGLDRAALRFSQYPHELSGGMNQRVMIALALSSSPRLLIADEPTTALDARIQRLVMDLIDDLRVSEGLSILLVSHDLGLVRDYADAIYTMEQGRTVEVGPPEKLAQQVQLQGGPCQSSEAVA